MNKKNKKIVIGILLVILLLAGCLSNVYASSGCPKGKSCTTRECGRYTDSNGNSLCDLAEVSASEVSVETSNIATINDSFITPENQETVDTTSLQAPSSTTNDFSSQETSVEKSSLITNLMGSLKSNLLIVIYLMFLTAAGIVAKANLPTNKKNTLRVALLILSIGLLGFYFGGCVCPIGGLQNLPLKLAGVASGDFFYWLLLVLLPIVFIFFVGRVFCSTVCPLGAIQEILFIVGKKLGLNQGNPGLKKMMWLRYIKYFVLIWLIVFTGITGYTLFCKYDPFVTLFALQGTLVSLLLLLLILALSLFVSRPWCRIICPYGGLLGILNKIAADGLHLAAIPGVNDIRCKPCNGCGVCIKECPVDAIEISKNTKNEELTISIDAYECINCKKCQ